MKNLKKLLALVLSVIMIISLVNVPLLISAEEVTTLYVSENGSDETGEGTAENPFLTVNKATTLVPDGDATIYVTGAVDLLPAVHTGMITIIGLNDTAKVKYVGYMNTNGPLTIKDVLVHQSGAALYTDGYKFVLDGKRDGSSKASYMFGNKTATAENVRDEDIIIINNSKGNLNPGTDYNIGHFGSVAITGGVNFLHKAGHIRWLNFSTATTFKGNVNITFDSFTQRTDDATQGYAEKVTGVPVFEKAFQVVYNNGIAANIKTEYVFETEAITATEGKWIIYGEAAEDGSLLRTTDTAGVFTVEGGLVAKAYKVVGGVESTSFVKSSGGVLDLSGIENAGIYNVKYTSPEAEENTANEVYVSAEGSDTNNGLTESTPFATIDFAQKYLNASTAEGEKIINVIGTVDFDGGESHDEMITIKAHTSAALNRITTNGKFTELQGPTKFVGFNLGWNDTGYPLSSGYDTEFSELTGRNRVFVGNTGNGALNNAENVIVNDSQYSSDNDRTTVYIGTDDATTRTISGVNFHFVNGRLAQFRLSNNNIYTGNVNLTLDKFGCLSEGVQLLVDGENIEFQKAFQFVINNGYSSKFQNLSLYEGINATEGSWFMYSDVATDGTVLRTTDTAGVFKVAGNLVANAYKVVGGVESETPIKSVNGILDLSGIENAGIYNVKYATRKAEANTDSVVYLSSEGSDLFDGETTDTAFGTLEFALNWLALSSAENKKIIVSGEHNFVSVQSDDMVTITSADGSAIINANGVKAGGPVTFENLNLKGQLYSNGKNVISNAVMLDPSYIIIGSDSVNNKNPDEVVIHRGGSYAWEGVIRLGASTNIASYGMNVSINGGVFKQVIFNDWAVGGTHYGDVNITLNGAMSGYSEGKIKYNTSHVFDGALQLILNGVDESAIDSTLYNIDAKDGEWFMIGEKTAKLSTTETEGVFTVNGAKYAKAVNREDATKVYFSKDGVLSVAEEGFYYVTYFNTLKQGDINGDGDIDIRDLVGIKNFIANILPYDLQADLNGDKTVSADDTVFLIKHLLGAEKIVWEDTLKYLSNTYTKLVEDKKLNVAFMGGSVTDGYGATNSKEKGWPKAICDWLAEKYDAEVIENRQSIGGTGSYFGSFRYAEDIDTVPDVFFIEFAINDYYEGYTYEESFKYSETLVRNALKMNPEMDIIYVLTLDRGVKTKDFDNLRAHRDVAEKYGFLCIKIADEFYEIMDTNGTKDYDYIPDGVHPNDEGYAIYAEIIKKGILSDLPAKNTDTSEITEKVLPEAISNYYENPHMLLAKELVIDSTDGWYIDTTGTKMIEKRYGGSIKSSTAGAKFSFTFEGKDFGILYHGATNIGRISVSIDGGAPQVFDGFYDGSNPRTFTVADDLIGDTHTVEITLLDGSFIIPAFLVN